MFRFIKSLILTIRYRHVVSECHMNLKKEYFPDIKLGQSLLDGMSADISVFMFGKILRKEGERLFVKVPYSIKNKGDIEAKGEFCCVYENGVVSVTRRTEA